MSAALPPVSDCGCGTSAASVTPTPAPGDCCPLNGVDNPNNAGLVPPDPTLWEEYRQLADLIAGPVVQVWYWNPNLSVWQ